MAAFKARRYSAGFTLVEIIVGLVISSIAVSLVATLIFPLYARSVEPVFQIRAAELAQSILDDALSRRYDQATPAGGSPPCDAASCTAAGALGREGLEADRGDFNDVDDFNIFCGPDFDPQDVNGEVIAELDNYKVSVCVAYDGNYNGVLNEAAADEINAKLITVTVTPPVQASVVEISAYRGNY
jgi:MSHA pilin protein MshD